MYCAHCGAHNVASATFCMHCGKNLHPTYTTAIPYSAASAPTAPAPFTPAAPVKKNNRKKYWLLGSIIASVAVIAILLSFLLTMGPKRAAKRYIDSWFDGNADLYLSCYPEEVLKEEIGNRSARNDYLDKLEDRMAENHDWMDEEYDDWEIHYKIIHVDWVSKHELDDIQEYYDDEYDCHVSAARVVTIKATLSHEDGKEVSRRMTYVIKVDGKWYIDVRYVGI